MTPEEVDTILQASAQWGAKQQSSLNTALLSFIALLLTLLVFGAKSYFNRIYTEMRDDIHAILDEIKDMKSDAIDTGHAITRHEEAIETLKNRRR